MMSKNIYLYILAGISLFIFSAGATFLVSSWLNSRSSNLLNNSSTGQTIDSTRRSKFDSSLPRTEPCPLNGALFSKPEKQAWEQRRPLAVMIENHEDSRPISGLSSADIVYEAVAEGGITRFMGIFYCGVAGINESLAPVRSARIYYTQLVLEYDALYNHVGGAGNCDDPTVNEKAKALCFIRRNNIKDLDQFGLAGNFKTCHRVTNRLDHEVAFEHTMVCWTDELYKVAEAQGWTNVDKNSKNTPWDKNFTAWKFKDDGNHGTTSSIKFDFWTASKDYSVEWQYDPTTNSYKRLNGGTAAMDLNTKQQITAKNVVVQFVRETGPVDEHKHMVYDVIGTGKMTLFQDGTVQTGTWSKASAAARTKYTLDSGKEVQFDKGQIWIELVPSTNKIEYN